MSTTNELILLVDYTINYLNRIKKKTKHVYVNLACLTANDNYMNITVT